MVQFSFRPHNADYLGWEATPEGIITTACTVEAQSFAEEVKPCRSQEHSEDTSTLEPLPYLSPIERVESRAMIKTMVIEPVSAFNGMDVLVARDEGFFAAEGLDLRIIRREPHDLRSSAEGTLEHPVTNQGRQLERGEAHMFQG